MTPDGLTRFHVDEARINNELRRLAARFGWPESELEDLSRARADGLACFWTRIGPRAGVEVGPDTAPGGNRAQRVHVQHGGCGLAQWTWLPLQRTRVYDVEILARSPDVSALRVVLDQDGPSSDPAAEVLLRGLSTTWRALRERIEVPAHFAPDKPLRFSVRADTPGQWVIAHAFLRPADHVQGADPDVIRFLKDSRLPVLRWPGGNFVSAYHWEHGVGPIEGRPSLPNYAWGGVEPNLFGTDEFIRFCEVVGCAPMICVNAGSGTPEEAARWIEYCNGGPDTAMGRLRAAHGRPEPYGVKHWEVGNELWGRWQNRWTSPAGYVDRFNRFARAMRAADPQIRLYACGAPVFWGKDWNDALIAGAAGLFDATTDHPLIGGDVDLSTDPVDVYQDFMAVPEVLERKWRELWKAMQLTGLTEPRLAVTELQLFAHLGGRTDTNRPVRLTRQNLPDQDSITEALYDVLIYHAAIRLAPFVEMVTHSATVNHGGGLRKERERVFANPCHYAQSSFAAFSGATPVTVEIECAAHKAPGVLPDLRRVTSECTFGIVDALGALATDGSLLVSIVHRGTSGPIRLQINLDGFSASGPAEIQQLGGPNPWAGNSLDQPGAIVPVDSTVPLRGDRLELDLAPYTVLRLRVPPTR